MVWERARSGEVQDPAERAAAPAPDSLPARLTAVIHGALGALKRPARAQAERQLRTGVLPLLTEAMASWAQGSKLDAPSFAHHFFHRDADDPIVTSLRGAAEGAKMATQQAQLAVASEQLANAMMAVGLDRWPRFVAHTVVHARDPVTLAAVTKSLQPALPKAAGVGTSGAGKGTRLAMAVEGEPIAGPLQEILEGGGATAGRGGGAMPDIGPPAAGAAISR